MQTSIKHERITRFIHWVSAILVIPIVTLGFYMAITESYHLYTLHKSFGLIAFILILVRFGWRKIHIWQSSTNGTGLESRIKRIHLVLLILLLLMPVTGLMYSGFGGFGVSLFGLPLIPGQHDDAGTAVPYSQGLSEFGDLAHEIVAYGFTGLLSLHILAALKHHLVSKDNTLTRMLGSSNTEREVGR